MVADGTVKRVVDKEELHDAASCNSGYFRVGVNFHGRCHLRAATGHRFGGFFDFNKTHSAVTGDFESFMITESGDLDTILFGCLINREVMIDLKWFTVDEDFYFFGGEGCKRSKDVLDEFKFGQHLILLMFLSLLQINN